MKQIAGVNIETIRSSRIPDLLPISRAIYDQIMFHPLLSKVITCLDGYLILKNSYFKLDYRAELESLITLATCYIPPGYGYRINPDQIFQQLKTLPNQQSINYSEYSIDNLLVILHNENSILQKKIQAELHLKYYYKEVTEDNLYCAYSTLEEIRSLTSTPNDVCMQIALYIQILSAMTPFTWNNSIKLFYLKTLENFYSCLAYLQHLPEDISMTEKTITTNEKTRNKLSLC